MKFFLVIICLIGLEYVKSQTNCGNCFPGTSESLCGYRQPTDPILCCNDGRKYTPCTFECVKKCIPTLSIVGCGAACTPSSGPCPEIPISTTQSPVTGDPVTGEVTGEVTGDVTTEEVTTETPAGP